MNTKQMKIMTILSKIPVVSTDVIYEYFKESGSPEKRSSEQLRTLAKAKLVEKQSREMGKTALWRLSKAGRDLMETKWNPVPFQTPKLDHMIEIARVYQWLDLNGELTDFIHEPHYPFGDLTYYPDAYFIWNGRAYLLEVQRSYLSADRWEMKWKIAEEFFKGPFKKASFQTNPAKIIKPRLICLAVGNPPKPENLNVLIWKEIEEMKAI